MAGKDNYAAGRAAAEEALQSNPNGRIQCRQNRAFMQRVVRYPAAEAGIRQFLDIGTGLPTSPNVHEVVQAVIPDARIVYADNDPIVLAHARALLTSSPPGKTAYVDADLRDIGGIPQAWERVAGVLARNGMVIKVRSRPEVERFFVGPDLVEPGVQLVHRWRPSYDDSQESPPADAAVSGYGGLAASSRNACQARWSARRGYVSAEAACEILRKALPRER